MKLLIAILALSLSATSFASMDDYLFDSQVNENKTYFETLNDLYATGTAPSLASLVKIGFAGRCFRSTAPDSPINGALILRQKNVPDVGPIGNGRVSYEYATIWNTTKPTDYYDNMSYDAILEISKATFNAIEVEQTSAVSRTDSQNSYYKMSGSYLIERLFSKTSEGAWENYVTCYYFKSNPKQ